MAVSLLQHALSSVSELERKFGPKAIRLWSDHDRDGGINTDVVNDAINAATEETWAYTEPAGYAAVDIVNSTLLRRWCTIAAGLFLSTDRGNSPPESLVKEFERIYGPQGQMVSLARSGLTLPGITKSINVMPALSNLRPHRGYANAKVRVVTETSFPLPSKTKQFRD